MLPAPVGTRTSTSVKSDSYASIVVTTDSVGIGVTVGITPTILVSMNAESVSLIAVNVVA